MLIKIIRYLVFFVTFFVVSVWADASDMIQKNYDSLRSSRSLEESITIQREIIKKHSDVVKIDDEGVLTIKTQSKTYHFISDDGVTLDGKGNLIPSTVIVKDSYNSSVGDIFDKDSINQHPLSYHYLAFLEDVGFHVVFRAQYYEDFDYLLISDKTGDVFFLNGIPHLSPSRKLIATVHGDECCGVNHVAVWSINDNKINNIFYTKGEMFYSKESSYWLASFVRWKNDNALVLTANTYSIDGKYCSDLLTNVPYIVKKTKAGWNIGLDTSKKLLECRVKNE